MAKRYPEEVRDAIYALMREGHGPGEIVYRLAHSKAGLEYEIEMPYRTCQDHMKRLRKDRGVPVPTIEPGREYDAATSLRREALELIRQELTKLKQKAIASDAGLSSTDLEKVAKLTRLLDDIARREEKKRGGSEREPEPGAEKTSAERNFLKGLAKLASEDGHGE